MASEARRGAEACGAGRSTACPQCDNYVTADGRSPGGAVYGYCDECERYVELWHGETGLRMAHRHARYDDGVWMDSRYR